jgi:hypothetical protein
MDGPHTGRDHPDTSHKAADRLRPRAPSIRQQVVEFALSKPRAFTDDELVAAHPDSPESSYRKRRSELTEENRIVDSRYRAENRHGNEAIMWVHRDHAHLFGVEPGAIRKRKPASQERAELIGSAHSTAASLLTNAAYLRRTYGLSAVAGEMETAADLLRRLAR